MPTDNGTVTRVGTRNIQFYVPITVSSHPACVFAPDDDFEVTTISGIGLLLTPPDISPTVGDVLNGLDPYIDTTDQPPGRRSGPGTDRADEGIARDQPLTTTTDTDADGETDS